jgi:hypothetical protein
VYQTVADANHLGLGGLDRGRILFCCGETRQEKDATVTQTSIAPLVKRFRHIGANLVVRQARLASRARPYDLNIDRDKKHGEHFRLIVTPDAPELHVLQADRDDRHLLLHVAGEAGGERFLCGHDERHWFAAAIGARVSTVLDAKRALLPEPLRAANITVDILNRRHSDVFKRQGEWFFVPVDRQFEEPQIIRNEPVFRDRRSKPHLCWELVRFGGTPVVLYKGTEYTEENWEGYVVALGVAGTRPTGRVEHRVKDPEVYVRGTVRHPDHATLILNGWHRLYGNMEARSVNLSFYD